ncbi:MAG: hypothetical protein J7K71_02935, partial [Candidatus Omnitrophica bacterium]|nr:hypothetical protein [Candidatus Omnitrophota bacterium]
RRVTSLVNYYLIKILFRVKVSDFQFVQIYKKKLLERIKVESSGTFVPPELIIRALSKGYRMKEYQTVFYPRTKGKSKCGKPKVISNTLYEMFKFWWKFKILKKP